jgi:hypothetical protein
MIESTKLSHQKSELVAFHRAKRKFIDLKDLETEDPDQLVMCEINGQDFELLAD